MNFLSISVDIEGRKLLVVGGGRVGYHKACILAGYGADVVVVSPQFLADFSLLSVTLVKEEYSPAHLKDVFLVYACTESVELNKQIRQDAHAQGILVSVCNAPSLCDFISPAVHRQGDMVVAVSSGGTDVRRAVGVRNRIRELFDTGTISDSERLTEKGLY